MSGDRQDYTLYANALVGDFILSMIYRTETPFGVIRRQAQQTANALREIDPVHYTERAEPSAQDHLGVPSIEGEIHEIPTDWVPNASHETADIPIFEEIDIPPPEPETASELASAPPAKVSGEPTQLPGDWVPAQPRPVTHLPFLEEPQFKTTERDKPSSKELPLPEAEYYLPITAILVPRFPEHQLTGALAENLQDWVERLCLAWDWRADEVSIHPDYLSLTVSLSPETAPSKAVHRLQDDLSNRVLNTFPELARDLPSGRFWARSFLLFTGGPPKAERVHSFVKTTRRGQGLET
ncbi:MAG: hypothetical protein GTO14_14130 [Anaerolineales bacterium]|nr:hypothetical protein [Anaerolineales bacterium]